MPTVVRNVGRVMKAVTSSGDTVERKEFIPMKDGMYPCVSSDTNFIYKTRRLGATTKCTCGGDAVIVSYAQYKQYTSYVGNEVLMCMSYAQRGCHADGSH
jgi:hypothetical protein